ncbi:MarR family transcriptional regulator [Dactylosporangium roseum]|uniref:MarR family transcriptional regulator n=1 Tax=Dactylosporangium roseum TaxID=47989 RepID=A0ABY5ZAJ3_9ACTN|nr:MarR family transcriptional regulator [Dactylosporangium roseum]UWZ38611.1 MarR family transcriptional regulator [Dactylosporangium roseum]
MSTQRDTQRHPVATEAVLHLHRAANAVRQHVEQVVLRPRQLTWTGFVVLRTVWAARRMETRHVAEHAGISKATLTGVVDTLSGRGLVRRDHHPDDGRLVVLQLTRKGRRLVRELLPESQTAEAFVLSYLEPAQLALMTAALRGLIEHLERAR